MFKNAFLMGDLLRLSIALAPGFEDSAILLCLSCYSGLFMGSSKPLGLGFSALHLILLGLVFLIVAIISSLHQEFAMTDLGPLNYFLGIIFYHTDSQSDYVITESYNGFFVDGDPVSDLTLYRSLAGSLQYLTFTRLDISYAVQQVCLHMHDPREPHLSALKRILHAEAEYRGVANAVAEMCWLRNLLRKLHTPLSSATIVYCDNVIAVYLSSNPVQHQRTKHIEIDIYFVRDLVAAGQVRVLHVPSRYQFAYIFTKGLPSALFEEFRTSLSVRCPPAPTVLLDICDSFLLFFDLNMVSLVVVNPITKVVDPIVVPEDFPPYAFDVEEEYDIEITTDASTQDCLSQDCAQIL
ncbi:ribonuclease H-like domain-containing protein [Tanacetum coccineum]